ncbi:MAG TPA: histidine kinase [Gaiellaceae bacterium]|nr:histidine kinase [Gaiellaceae bacterium]
MSALLVLARRHGDVLLALALVALGLVETALDDDLTGGEQAASAGLLAVLGVLLALRRRYPLVLLAVLAAGAAAEPWTGEVGDGEVLGVIVLVSVYTAAAHTDGLRLWLAGGLTFATAWIVMANDPDGIYLGAMVFFGILFGTPWLVGRALRHRRLREAQLEREKAEAQAAVAEERARIARELHDVVAHAISVIVLQARGGRKLLAKRPEEAREALDAIERTAAQALAEMRRLLGLLRESDEALALAPQPTLARLDDLVAQVREAGLPVEVVVEGRADELPPGVDLSAYRIVQEALTNALKHAGPATARVTIRYREGELELEVADDGAGGTTGEGAAGHGLVGIRERVAVFGGEVESGRRPQGGYAVRARLPYAAAR